MIFTELTLMTNEKAQLVNEKEALDEKIMFGKVLGKTREGYSQYVQRKSISQSPYISYLNE